MGNWDELKTSFKFKKQFTVLNPRLFLPDSIAILSLIILPFAYFWRVTLGQGIWYTADIASIYHPFAVELARALSQRRLPLWTPSISAGFPLVAEGHVAAFYPVNWLLLKIFPPHYAISYDMLLHLAAMAVGLYLLVRSLGMGVASALFAGLIFSFNAYMIQKFYHPPILITLAWLPWMIFFQHKFQLASRHQSARAGIWLALAALAITLQWVAGFPQTAFLSALAFALFGFFGALYWNHFESPRKEWKTILRAALWTAAPMFLGVSIAAIQIVPTVELIGYSVRGGTQPPSFQYLDALPPAYLTQFVMPFAHAIPSEEDVESWGYFGIVPLALALVAPFVRRDARTIFLSVFSLAALSFTLGQNNPLYQALAHLPVFNFFRIPARYLALFLFAATLLSATTLDELMQRAAASSRQSRIVLAMGVITLAAIGLASSQTQPLEFWLNVCQYLPAIMALIVIVIVGLALTRRIERRVLGAAVIGLTIFDLIAHATVFALSMNPLTPPSLVETTPRSVSALESEPGWRVLTSESNLPSDVEGMRASLAPNLGLVYGKTSARSNTPLGLKQNETYLFALSPTMLNLLNVKNFLIPLEGHLADRWPEASANLAMDVYNKPIAIQPTATARLEVTSFTQDAAHLTDGALAGEFDVRLRDGSVKILPLRVGIETADWDDERERTNLLARHSRPPVARTFQADWQAHSFQSNTFLARYSVAETGTLDIVGINFRPAPDIRVWIENISLVDDQGKSQTLATLTRKNNFSVTYLSERVAVFQNADALPRAFIAHDAKVLPDDDAFAALHQPRFRADSTVLLAEGQPLAPSSSPANDHVRIERDEPERVTLSAQTDQPGYLVLTDVWYPGWSVSVDRAPAPLYRADFIFRAVPVEPGNHQVIFEYRPASLTLGAAISAVGIVLTIAIAFALTRIRDWNR